MSKQIAHLVKELALIREQSLEEMKKSVWSSHFKDISSFETHFNDFKEKKVSVYDDYETLKREFELKIQRKKEQKEAIRSELEKVVEMKRNLQEKMKDLKLNEERTLKEEKEFIQQINEEMKTVRAQRKFLQFLKSS